MLSGFVIRMNDVAFLMRLVNTDTKLRISCLHERCSIYAKRFCYPYERCSIFNAFSEYGYKTAYLLPTRMM